LLAGHDASGALLFTCNGRGQHFFGVPDHDAGVVDRLLGPLPIAGALCAGEIGRGGTSCTDSPPASPCSAADHPRLTCASRSRRVIEGDDTLRRPSPAPVAGRCWRPAEAGRARAWNRRPHRPRRPRPSHGFDDGRRCVPRWRGAGARHRLRIGAGRGHAATSLDLYLRRPAAWPWW
jgi:hypothetical protein